METRCVWRQSRPMHFLLLMCLYLPTLIRARSMPQGSDFPNEVLALRRPDVSSLQQDRVQFGTVVAACAKHHIACHLLRGQSTGTVQAPVSSGEYARENDRMLMTYSTVDYSFERPDSNPATVIYVPVVASPLYSPYSTGGTAPPPP